MENKDSLYIQEKQKTEDTLKQLLDEVNDLKVSYGYSEIKNSDIPFKFQSQIQLINRMLLSKNMKNEFAVADIKNNGHFMAYLQEFDTFSKTDEILREHAVKILCIERAVKRANDYLKGHSELLPNTYPLVENKDLFKLAYEYLLKSQLFDSFDQQKYRSAIVKQAIMSGHISAEKIAQDIKQKAIRKADIVDLPKTIIGANEKLKAHYENIYNTVIKTAFPDMNKVETTNKDTIKTTVVGVSYSNENGEKRQEIIAEMKEKEKKFPVEVELKRGTYKDKPCIGVFWNNKQVGNINQSIATNISTTYPSNDIKGLVTEITGGFEQKNQDGTVKTASLGLNITIEVDLLKEKAETKVKEQVKEQTEKV